MPDYAAPGMNVEERDRNPHPITGVSTSTAAFIGFAASGPFMPTPITSPTEYQLVFGSPNGTGFLGHAVGGFFRNGGTRCYVLRVEATVGAESATSVRTEPTLPRSRFRDNFRLAEQSKSRRLS